MEPQAAAQRRFVMKQAADLYLRMTVALSDMFEGNLVNGVVFLAIARANVQHLRRGPDAEEFDEDGVYPDELRRPVSVLSVANFLGLSYETTRRHVALLVEEGLCVKVGRRGVVAPAAVMRRSQVGRLSEVSDKGVKALLRGLKEIPELLDEG